MFKSRRSIENAKAILVFGVMLILFLVAIGALVNWQIVRGEELKIRATNQSLVPTELSAMRGTIYDATGDKILAQSASVWNVALDSNYIEQNSQDKELLASGLASILGLEYDYVYERASLESNFTYIAKKIESNTRDQILTFLDENEIGGSVILEDDYKRYYPYGSTASVVIGFTGSDNSGLAGLEYEYNELLSGTTGQMVSFKNAHGTDMPFQYEQFIAPESGNDLILTIDETVQSIVEKHLREGIEKYEAKEGATAVVMDVNTGAIIALATGSDYDLNDPFTIADEDVLKEINAMPDEEQSAAINDALQTQWRNKAVSDTYYPGSVFKPITGSSALETGAITSDTTFTCTGSYVPYEGADPISCWHTLGHGTQTIEQAISNSCNPFMMQMADQLGIQEFYSYFEAFGFADVTGIDLPGETQGVARTGDEMDYLDLMVYSFGQNFGVTPIQMITAMSAVANGGYIVQPHVVDKVIDEEGNVVQEADTTYKRQVISEETSKEMAEIMQEAATNGTAQNGNVPGYKIAGKTGTSEKIDKWVLDPTQPKEYIASYCGFAPADDPQYACLVYYDEPTDASGSGQAAPTFSSIMREILPYLGVEMSLEDGIEQVVVPSVLGLSVEEAKTAIEEKGLEWEVFGDDSEEMTVLAQTPSSGTLVLESGQVIIYTEENLINENLVKVPDFTGKTVSECNELITSSGLQMMFSGASSTGYLLAENQDVVAGSMVEPGTVITITFIDYSSGETTTETAIIDN